MSDRSFIKELFQHAATTHGVTVRVAVNFLPEQSRIEAGKWFWVYHIRIENDSDRTLQLVTRHWRITDGRGAVNLVEGEWIAWPSDPNPAGEGIEAGLHVGDAGQAIAAAAAGLGRARVPLLLAQGWRDLGRIPGFGEPEPARKAYWLVAPLPQWRQKKVKALVAHLTA